MITQDRKVVELLRLLGDDVSQSVLSKLRPERASRIRGQLKDEDQAPISAQRQLRILEEFDRVFALFNKSSGGGVRLHEPDEDHEDEASTMTRLVPMKPFSPSGDAMRDLERIHVHQLATALETEQARTVAALLNEISPERTAEVLSLFPDEARDAVVRELSGATRAHPMLVERMAQSVLSRAMTLPVKPADRPDRVQRLASVLRAVDRPLRKKMLEAIREQDGETADGLVAKMYVFEDLAKLKDRQVQKLLTEVDSKEISTAMFGADAAIVDKVINNLSRRAREALQEEMQFRTDVPEQEVKLARDAIAKAIAKMDQES